MANDFWRGYIKDQFNLEAKPKAFVKIISNSIKEDLLVSATSTFECLEVSSNISKGDVLVVLDSHSKKKYCGVISTIEETTITTNQIFNIYAGNWIYDLPSYIGVGDNKSWLFERYTKVDADYPSPSDVEGLTPTSTSTILDSSTNYTNTYADNYTGKATTYVYSISRKKITLDFITDDNGSLYINDKKIGTTKSCESSTFENCLFKRGWNKIEVLYNEGDGNDGWLLTYNSSHIYNCGLFEKMTSEITDKVTSLEAAFATALEKYANGEMRDSLYVDELVKQRIGNIKIIVGSNTEGKFTTKSDNYTVDMETFIYSLYENYRILLDFDINYEGENSVTIKKLSSETNFKIGDNTKTIQNISPVTEISETNRVIIYDSDGIYRTTYVTKADGTRVEEPNTTANRFGVVNTNIVFSDDELEDILEANLPTEMYNHKLTFSLMTCSNIFSFDDFILGMPLQVWKGTSYYQTILTGREYSKSEIEGVNEIKYTCGNVRTKMTDKMLLKFGVLK